MSTEKIPNLTAYSEAVNTLNDQKHICAFKKRSRLFFDRSEDSKHLEILDYGPFQAEKEGHICVYGKVKYIGCDTGTVICMDAISDYGISIESIAPEKITKN